MLLPHARAIRIAAVLFLSLSLAGPLFSDDQPKWVRVNTAHFSVLTDAGSKSGSEVILRLEQMRTVCGQLLLKNKLNMPEPLTVIGFKTFAEYAQFAPLRQGQPVSGQGFFLAGEDRNFIVLNLADEESWISVAPQFAGFFLNHNYPPTQPWFDEGFVQYFASLRVDDRQAQIGAAPASFVELLSSRPWLPLPALFATVAPANPSQREPLFQAESWIVLHYLLNKNKLSETGNYFELVENENVPVEEAIQRAFSTAPAQLEQSVKDYFRSFSAGSNAKPDVPNPGVSQFAVTIGPNDVGMSITEVVRPEAEALLAESMVRVPEHRDEGVRRLNGLMSDPLTDTSIAHRALAWVDLEKNDFAGAGEELATALQLNQNDPWTHFYLARMKYRQAQSNGNLFPGLANMMQDLRIVLNWDPDFAEALRMLAMARVEGGGVHSALEAMQVALQLSPRREDYLLDLASIHMAGKKWDQATALLEHLKGSANQEIAAKARRGLEDLPTLRKYGLLPQHAAANKAPPPKPPDHLEDEEAEQRPPAPVVDRRRTQYLRGKLVTVDCSQPPSAVLTIAAASKNTHLRTEDYKSLLLIGADDFSCEWKDRQIVANYKAGGKSDGDLVSLEIH